METVEISTTQLYKLLISDLRYGYTRNNHLMPSCAYGEVKSLLNKMLEKDKDTAITTAKQLCEECISDQLAKNFWDGLDDEFGNRKEAIDFINYLLDFVQEDYKEWRPYNYNLYETNLENENKLKYNIIKLNNFDASVEDLYSGYQLSLLESWEFKYIRQDVSMKEANIELFENILKATSGTYNKRTLTENNKVVGELFRIITPENHKGEIYGILLTEDNYEAIEK